MDPFEERHWNLGQVLSWVPDGSGTVECADLVGCSVISEPFALNDEIQVLSQDTDMINSSGNFTVRTGLLSANVIYSVAISHDVNVSAEATKVRVSEPATLLLFGTSLLGMGLMGWRRRRQTAA